MNWSAQWRRIASSKTPVPTTSVRAKSSAFWIERSTCVSAAKFTITSASLTRGSTALGSQISPFTKRTFFESRRSLRFSGLRGYVSLSRTMISSCFDLSRKRTKFEPMNPMPPVTSTTSLANGAATPSWGAHAAPPVLKVWGCGVELAAFDFPAVWYGRVVGGLSELVGLLVVVKARWVVHDHRALATDGGKPVPNVRGDLD